MDLTTVAVILGIGIVIGDRIAVLRSRLFAPRPPEIGGYVVSAEQLQQIQQSQGSPLGSLLLVVLFVLLIAGLVLLLAG